MRLLLYILIIICTMSQPAQAVPITSDLSSHHVEIHSRFTGTQILLFGARNDPGDIIVIFRGPEKDFVMRKKERVAGIWVNRQEETFEHIPNFYAIASNRPLEDIQEYLLFDTLDIIDLSDDTTNATSDFKHNLERILSEQQLYREQVADVEFMGETLFKTVVDFPDNMPRGTYTAEVYLFSDGALSGMQTIPIQVFKTGFDAFLYDAANHHAFLYGACAIVIALSVGWFASWFFRKIE